MDKKRLLIEPEYLQKRVVEALIAHYNVEDMAAKVKLQEKQKDEIKKLTNQLEQA